MKIITILLIVFVTASTMAITLDFPEDGRHLPTITPNLNATNNLTNANITFYVNTSDGFNEDNAVCNILNTSDTEVNCTFIAIPHVLDINSIDFYFKADEHLGNTTDNSGGGMDMLGDIVGTPTYFTQGGVTDGYFEYNKTGSNYHQDLTPSFTVSHLDDFTYGMWIRVPEENCIAGSNNNAGGQGLNSNAFTAFGRTNSVALSWDNVMISLDDANCRSGGGIPCNEWVFIVGRWDNVHSCQTFINGEQKCTSTCWDGNGFSTTTAWRVGNFGEQFFGQIDEAWFDKGVTWSDSDILRAYEFGEGVYYWKVNGTNATTSDETETRNFTLDITPPVIFLNLTDEETTDTLISYLTNATDTNPITLNISYQKSDINNTSGDSPVELTGLQSLQFGVNNFIVTAIDLAGNVAFAQAILIKTGWNNVSFKFYDNESIKNYDNQSWRIYV